MNEDHEQPDEQLQQLVTFIKAYGRDLRGRQAPTGYLNVMLLGNNVGVKLRNYVTITEPLSESEIDMVEVAARQRFGEVIVIHQVGRVQNDD